MNVLKSACCPHEELMYLSLYRALLSSHDDNSTIFNGTGAKLDHWKTATEQRKWQTFIDNKF